MFCVRHVGRTGGSSRATDEYGMVMVFTGLRLSSH